MAPVKAQRAAARASRFAAGAGLLLAVCLLSSARQKHYTWPNSGALSGAAQAPATSIDVALPSALAGRQQKHGPLGILVQLNRAHKEHGQAVPLFPPEWVSQRVGGDRRAPPPLRVSHIMLSEHYKLIYVKCTKTAGKAWRARNSSACDAAEPALSFPCCCQCTTPATVPLAAL